MIFLDNIVIITFIEHSNFGLDTALEILMFHLIISNLPKVDLL